MGSRSSCCGCNWPTKEQPIYNDIEKSLRGQIMKTNKCVSVHETQRIISIEQKKEYDLVIQIQFNDASISWNYSNSDGSFVSLQTFISNHFAIDCLYSLNYNSYDELNMFQIQNDTDLNKIVEHAKHKCEHTFIITVVKYIKQDLPLKHYTSFDVETMVRNWILNDMMYTERKEILMNIVCFDGKKLKEWTHDNDLKYQLKKRIQPFMTDKTFDKIIKCFQEEIKLDMICNKQKSQIAEHISNFELISLCKYIKTVQMNGKTIINNKNNYKWIKKCTGWDEHECEQLIRILLKQKTDIRPLPNELELNLGLNECKLEMLQLNVKNGKFIDEDTVKIMNAIDEFQRKIKPKNPIFIQETYETLSKCIQTKDEWICYNCGNRNFQFRYGNTEISAINICKLCGIQQIQSITLALRGDCTLRSVLNHQKSILNNISCPNTFNSNQTCPCVSRLVEKLQFYQKWLEKINKSDNSIQFTSAINMNKLDNAKFRDIFVKTAQKINTKTKWNVDISELNLLMDNHIISIQQFIDNNTKTFIRLLTTNSNINLAIATKLCRSVQRAINTTALYNNCQDYEFFTKNESNQFNADFHHIHHLHIQKGNKHQIQNLFRYFQKKIQCKEQCLSLSRIMRRENRIDFNDDCPMDSFNHEIFRLIPSNDCELIHQYISNNEYDTESLKFDILCLSHKGNMVRIFEEKLNLETMQNIFSETDINQQYIQYSLDLIHSFLVHTDWEHYFDTNDNKHAQVTEKNKDKFITDVTIVDDYNSYGFGVDHNYIYLSPIHSCMKDELMKFEKHPISVDIFEMQLVKALNMKEIAEKQYALKCNRYDPNYNIPRNQPIGVRHILSIANYTDLTTFCKLFRETYRRLTKHETKKQVKERHRHLYWCSRFLFEAIEFYGSEMHEKMEVHHGLNKELLFSKFIAFFNAPISTTTQVHNAKQFANGGIVVTFKRCKEKHLIPRFMDASWISDFKREKERLFYGENIKFQIVDIIQCSTNKHHKSHLKQYNIFQQLLTNKAIKWDENHNVIQQMKKVIIPLINQRKNGDINAKKIEQIEFIEKMFHSFCENKTMTSVIIKDFESINMALKTALLMSQSDVIDQKENTEPVMLSFIGLSKIFPNCREITFNDLDLQIVTKNGGNYIQAIIQYIEYINENNKCSQLRLIIFQSEEDNRGRENMMLNEWKTEASNNKLMCNWNVEYKYNHLYHTLTFTSKESLPNSELDIVWSEAYKKKNIKNWNNNDLLNWMNSIGIKGKWKGIMIEIIRSHKCNGNNWFDFHDFQQLAEQFDIKQPMLACRVFREFKNAKQIYPLKEKQIDVYQAKDTNQW
eukprot:255013_1